MVDMMEVFGGNAGLVWKVLKRRSPLTAKEISSRTKLKTDDVFIALGWLGREGKISIDDGKRSLRYSLLD